MNADNITYMELVNTTSIFHWLIILPDRLLHKNACVFSVSVCHYGIYSAY